jgi:flagellar motility protein MotE (MotC chaperone)
MNMLRSPLVAFVLGVIIYLATTAAVWKFPKPVAAHNAEPGQENEAPVQEGPSWTFKNPEIEQLVLELKTEKEAIAIRQKQLNELSDRLQNERMELNQVTQKVFLMQKEFDKNVVKVKEAEVVNLKKLAKGYSLMDPQAAGNILKGLEEDQFVKILLFMKEAESAPILEALSKQGEEETKKAVKITDKLRTAIPPGPSAKAKPK